MPTLVKEQLKVREIPVEGYEKVYAVEDPSVHLKGIICLHNLSLGPALGGIRIYPYATYEDALTDAKRLALGMTYKSAVAGCGWGGGKSVIIADPFIHKTEGLLRSFGRAIESLGGSYIGAEDVGCSPIDIDMMSKETKYVVGLSHEKSSGNPSYFTAWGVYRGIQAGLKKVYGSDVVKGRTIAIQGLGSVGAILADILFWNGASLIMTDISEEKAQKIVKHYSATYCKPQEILSAPCDVFAPCALGGIINAQTIPQLKCKIVAGAANNQLLTEVDGIEISRRGILYAPDFVINAGGLMNVSEELSLEGYNSFKVRGKVDGLYEQLLMIFDIAEKKKISTHQAATSLGDYRLKYQIGKREAAPCFHHSM